MDRRVASLRLTAGSVNVLCPCKTLYLLLILVQPRKTGNNPETSAAVDGTPLQIPTFLPTTFTLGSRSHKM